MGKYIFGYKKGVIGDYILLIIGITVTIIATIHFFELG